MVVKERRSFDRHLAVISLPDDTIFETTINIRSCIGHIFITRREKYSNVLQTHIVIVGQVQNMSIFPKL